MNKDHRRIITCSHCHRENMRNAGHNWCGNCYSKWWQAGKPEGGPPPIRTNRDWVVLDGLKRSVKERQEYWLSVREEYFEFRDDFGLSMKDAAARIGIHITTARRYEREKRNERMETSESNSFA